MQGSAGEVGEAADAEDPTMSAFFRADLFSGQVVLVTGGGTGIGFVLARAFGQLGAQVVIASRTESTLAHAVARMEAEGSRADWVAVDTRDPDSVQQLVDETVRRYGKIDVGIANAGGQFALREEDLTANGWRAVIDLNLNGTWFTCQSIGRHMIERGEGGKLIAMSTSFPHRGSPGIVHRGAAAAGVLNLVRTLALAWTEYDIQVNAIGPQYLTPGAKENYGAEIDEYIRDVTPAHRWGRPHEIAGMTVMLASSMADYTTGALIPIDGGCFLGPAINYRGSAVLPDPS